MTKIWRVQLSYGEGAKLRAYDRKSKIYLNKSHAVAAYNEWVRRGFKVSLLEAKVSEWIELK